MAGSQMERERPERRPQKGPGGPRRWKRPRVHSTSLKPVVGKKGRTTSGKGDQPGSRWRGHSGPLHRSRSSEGGSKGAARCGSGNEGTARFATKDRMNGRMVVKVQVNGEVTPVRCKGESFESMGRHGKNRIPMFDSQTPTKKGPHGARAASAK